MYYESIGLRSTFLIRLKLLAKRLFVFYIRQYAHSYRQIQKSQHAATQKECIKLDFNEIRFIPFRFSNKALYKNQYEKVSKCNLPTLIFSLLFPNFKHRDYFSLSAISSKSKLFNFYKILFPQVRLPKIALYYC